MIDLSSLKADLITSLKGYWEGLTPTGQEYYSLELDLPELELANLFYHFQARPMAFWQDRSANRQIIALGTCQTFRSPFFYGQSQKLLKENRSLIFIGGQKFFTDIPSTDEWIGFDKTYFFIPIVAFKKVAKKHKIILNFSKKVLDSGIEQMNYLLELDRLLNFKPATQSPPSLHFNQAIPEESEWNANINHAISQLDEEKKEKVANHQYIICIRFY